MTETDAPIDLVVLGRLMGRSDPETINQMLAMFWQSEGESPKAMRAAADKGDARGLASAAHGAKGAAAGIGAQKVADACKALELAAKVEDWPAAKAHLLEVEAAYAAVEAFIAKRTG